MAPGGKGVGILREEEKARVGLQALTIILH